MISGGKKNERITVKQEINVIVCSRINRAELACSVITGQEHCAIGRDRRCNFMVLRIYMKNGRILRYIGPDHVTVDYAHTINPDDLAYRYSSDLSGGDTIAPILNAVFPGWWTIYEGERE